MSARDDILNRVGTALAGADRTTPAVSRGYRNVTAAGVDLVDLFVTRVEDYRATVTRCDASELVPAMVEAVGARSVVAPTDFSLPLSGWTTDSGQSADELDQLDGVVSTAALGIASTGTIVLDHSAGQGRRALTLVPDLHVCVIRAEQIVYGVPDAIAQLDPLRPQTWISGPSATSDIELNRVEGVHGPRHLHVIVVQTY